MSSLFFEQLAVTVLFFEKLATNKFTLEAGKDNPSFEELTMKNLYSRAACVKPISFFGELVANKLFHGVDCEKGEQAMNTVTLTLRFW